MMQLHGYIAIYVARYVASFEGEKSRCFAICRKSFSDHENYTSRLLALRSNSWHGTCCSCIAKCKTFHILCDYI